MKYYKQALVAAALSLSVTAALAGGKDICFSGYKVNGMGGIPSNVEIDGKNCNCSAATPTIAAVGDAIKAQLQADPDVTNLKGGLVTVGNGAATVYGIKFQIKDAKDDMSFGKVKIGLGCAQDGVDKYLSQSD